jgi:hypothetical protein
MSIVSKVETYCDICGVVEHTGSADTDRLSMDRIGWLQTREAVADPFADKKVALPPPEWKPPHLIFVRDQGNYRGDYCPSCALKIFTQIRNLKISFLRAGIVLGGGRTL